ncbi:MAG: HAD family hydrolase [Chloroflexota bacterium]
MSLFLFDIDGTILRGSTEVHRAAFAYAYQEIYGLDLSLDGIVAAGRTDAWLFEEPLRRARVPYERVQRNRLEAFAVMEAYVTEHLEDLRDRVLPGVREVLSELREACQTLGLLTGNLEGVAAAKMVRAGLEDYFQFGVYGSESVDRSQLVPIALRLARTSGVVESQTQATVIGDTPLDIAAARDHNLRSVAVATGPFSVEDLRCAGADLVFESLAEPETVRRLLDRHDLERPASSRRTDGDCLPRSVTHQRRPNR